MSEHANSRAIDSRYTFSVEGGKYIRLKTAGKYCDRDIVVNATDNLDALIDNTITEVNSLVTLIGPSKFYKCSSLTKVNFLNVTEIGESAFNGCGKLSEANIPKATTIGTSAFNNCYDLKTAYFPLATTIGTATTFQNCKSLHTVDIPNLREIPSYAFKFCTSLTKVKFPAVEEVNTYAFDSCSNLKIVDLARVDTISANAFRNCSNLVALAIRHDSTICKLSGTNAFTGTPIVNGAGFIYAPENMIDSLKAASNWSTYAAQFRVLEQYTVDGTVTGELDESKIGWGELS